jgi:hypothetical protein
MVAIIIMCLAGDIDNHVSPLCSDTGIPEGALVTCISQSSAQSIRDLFSGDGIHVKMFIFCNS